MYKVVIIDDEPIITKGLRKTIPWEDYGCEIVAIAEDGRNGREIIKEHEPNIVFTDIRMPNLDGLAMIAGLKSEFPNMEVTILTGYRNIEYAQAAIKLGVRRYLLKPSKMEEIKEAIEAMIHALEEMNVIVDSDSSAMSVPVPDSVSASVASVIEAVDAEPDNFIVRNALRYIEANYMQRISLADLASNMYVSQWHLSKLLNKHTGQNFSDLLNGVRITRAKELLKDHRLKIHDVSELSGFTDVTHFAKIFKKNVGVTANEYRKKL